MPFTLLISNNYKNKPFCRKITNAEKYRLEVVNTTNTFKSKVPKSIVLLKNAQVHKIKAKVPKFILIFYQYHLTYPFKISINIVKVQYKICKCLIKLKTKFL